MSEAAPQILQLYQFSEFLEIASAALLAAGVVLWNGADAWIGAVAALLLIAATVAVQISAERHQSAIDRAWYEVEQRRLADRLNGYHAITPQLLKTLKAVGMEEDVLDALNARVNCPAIPESDFERWLSAALGPARAAEKMDVIVKYTRVEENGVV